MQRYRAEHPKEGVLYLDAGRAFPLRTQESDVVIPHMMDAFQELGLDAFNVGEADLDGGIGFLTALMRGAGIPAVSANLVSIDTGRPWFPPFTVITPRTADGTVLPGPKVAVVGFTEPAKYEILTTPDGSKVHFVDPAKIAPDVIPEARKAADAVIVLANFGAGTAHRVADATSGIDLIIGNDQRIEDPLRDDADGVPIVLTGVLGKRTIRIDFRRDAAGGWTTAFTITELDEHVPEDPAARDLMDGFDRILAARTRDRAEARTPDPHEPKYLGSAACRSCHSSEYDVWSASRHAHAWEPLRSSSNAMNPLCIGCHSTGYLRPNGFFIEAGQPNLVSVGCESCHGAGGAHVEEPEKKRMLKGEEKTCRGCHTSGQTPDFDFEAFWSRIRH